MDYVLIIGGNSDIGRAIATEYARMGYNLFLTYRKPKQIDSFCRNLSNKNSISVIPSYLDVLDFNSHKKFYKRLNPKPIGVITSVGLLDNQSESEKFFDLCLRSINTNYVGLVSLLNIIASHFIDHRTKGFIIGISSVAGERGRSSNYIYGSAKSGFTTYLSGLRSQLNQYDIHVLTVLPGYVVTKMTKDIKLPRLITCSPEFVSKKIIKAQIEKKNVIYIKWFWKYIMYVVKSIPESFFKKLDF